FIEIAGDAVAAEQHDREVVLRDALALLGCPAIPRSSLREVARDALSGAIHDAELELGPGMSRLGRAAEPGCRRFRIARSPCADQRVVSNDPLRGDVPCFRRRAIATDRFGLVRPGAAVLGVEMTELQ